MLALSSEVTIGKFKFSGVYAVHISRSIHSLVETATITLPSLARILKDGKIMPDDVVTGKQFSDGDLVTIKLGYNGALKTEFVGFVQKRDVNMPLEVRCEGFSWLLRRNNVNNFWSSVSVKGLLEEAVSGIDGYSITVKCETDLKLTDVRMANKCGFDVISSLSKYTDGCLKCFFIEPGVLWCGLAYTPIAHGSSTMSDRQVKYRLGFNSLQENNLSDLNVEDDPVEVTYSRRLADGRKIIASSVSSGGIARSHNRILNHVPDVASLSLLATEKAYQLNYSGYEGSLTAFLQTFTAPGDLATLSDSRYPDRNGQYLVESTEVNFGVNGARRTIELGPRLGFLNDPS